MRQKIDFKGIGETRQGRLGEADSSQSIELTLQESPGGDSTAHFFLRSRVNLMMTTPSTISTTPGPARCSPNPATLSSASP